MVIGILLLIIAILLAFIVWLYKAYILVDPSVGNEDISKSAIPSHNSIVGKTRSVMLTPPKPKLKVSTESQFEDIESIFMNNEFEEEHIESQNNRIPQEEQDEVIDTDSNVESHENVELQENICIDYEQILTSTTKAVRNEPLDINDAETLRKLEGTDITVKLEQAMPTYQAIVSARLAELEY